MHYLMPNAVFEVFLSLQNLRLVDKKAKCAQEEVKEKWWNAMAGMGAAFSKDVNRVMGTKGDTKNGQRQMIMASITSIGRRRVIQTRIRDKVY
jgi:hypothetical protein